MSLRHDAPPWIDVTQYENTVTEMQYIGAGRSEFGDPMPFMVFNDAVHIANAQHADDDIEPDSPQGVEEGDLKKMPELVDAPGVMIYVSDLVEVISVHDGTLERDDTPLLLGVSAEDEDWSGMPGLTDDSDSEISETDAHEIGNTLFNGAVDNGDTLPSLLSYYDARELP